MSKKKPTLPNKPEEWARARVQIAYEKNASTVAVAEADTLDAYTPSEEREASAWNSLTKEQMENEWESLRRFAIIRFPEGSSFHALTPNNRLVAIAHCFGWSQAKIASASGVATSTIRDWLKRPDIKCFIEEFNIKQNQADPDRLWTDLSYKALKIADNILSGPDADPRLKFDVSKWVMERKYGKPNQPIEHKGLSMKDLIKTLGELKLDLVPAGVDIIEDPCFEDSDTEH